MLFKNKSLLITGGTGSLGNAIVDFVIKYKFQFKKIIIFSRDELKQYEMNKKFDKKINLRFFLGDVRDLARIKRAVSDVDMIIHAAALKQVDKAELDPFEAIKTNILGAQNIIDASLDSKVSNIVALSTDKASSPLNLYGATKLCSDKLFMAARNIAGNKKINFSVIRYGNVFNSRGSVFKVFENQIEEGVFTITDPEMTRFMITLPEAVKFIFESIKNSYGSEIFIPKLKSFRVVDLARALKHNAKLKIIGIRPGEKIHEELFSISDSYNAIELRNSYILRNDLVDKLLLKKYEKLYKGKKIFQPFCYNSKENKYLTIADLKKIIFKNI